MGKCNLRAIPEALPTRGALMTTTTIGWLRRRLTIAARLLTG
jgi:hypothetical protein